MKAPSRSTLPSPPGESAQGFSSGQFPEDFGEFLWVVDEEGRYTHLSGHVKELTGYEPHELLGHHYTDILAEPGKEKVKAAAAALFASRAEIHSLLNEILTKDGRRVTVLTSGHPVIAADGTLLGYSGSDRNVTGLFEITGQKHRFQSVLDRANFGISLADEDSTITYVNDTFARDHGYERDELIGRPVAFLHSPSQMGRVEELIGIIHSAGSFTGEEVWHRRKDGSEFPMLITGILLTEPDGSRSLAATALDITDRKRVEMELIEAKAKAEQSDRTKSEFLSMISHEFRTPLNHILGFSTLISQSVSDPEIAEYSQTIRRSAEDFLELVDDLIELSASDSWEIRPRKKPFLLSEFLKSAEKCVGSLLSGSGKEHAVRVIPFDASTIANDLRAGDVSRLRLLLEPLVKNAVKFTASGSISVSCREDGESMVRFRVTDTGPGIPEDRVADIFQPFVQASTGSTRRFGGLGVGLAVARKIAAALGGEVRLVSSGPSGTTVEAAVPLPAGR